jgi:hypothetical protein
VRFVPYQIVKEKDKTEYNWRPYRDEDFLVTGF